MVPARTPQIARADGVLRHRAHGAAEPGPRQDEMQRQRQRDDAEQDVEVGGRDDDAPERWKTSQSSRMLRRGRAGHAAREIAQDQQQPDRHQHRADDGLLGLPRLERLEQVDIHQPAEAEEDRRQHRRDQNRVQVLQAANMTLAATPAMASSVPCAKLSTRATP